MSRCRPFSCSWAACSARVPPQPKHEENRSAVGYREECTGVYGVGTCPAPGQPAPAASLLIRETQHATFKTASTVQGILHSFAASFRSSGSAAGGGPSGVYCCCWPHNERGANCRYAHLLQAAGFFLALCSTPAEHNKQITLQLLFSGAALESRKPHRGWQVGSAALSDPCRQLFSLGSARMGTNEAQQSIWQWALERPAPAAGGCSPGALPRAPCWPGAALPSLTAGRSSPQSARLPHCRGLRGRH